MSHQKLCKNCKYSRRDIPLIFTAKFVRCFAKQLGVEPVAGKPVRQFATLCREFDHLCGREARWFEPK